jgi:hypothetical protein
VNARRKTLLVLLIPLFGVLLLGGIGEVEYALWLVLVAAWLNAFAWWAKASRQPPD